MTDIDTVVPRDLDKCFICGGQGLHLNVHHERIEFCPEDCKYARSLRAYMESGTALPLDGHELQRLAESITNTIRNPTGSVLCVMVDGKLDLWTSAEGAKTLTEKVNRLLELEAT